MRFSVLMPVYNVEQYLEAALESVLTQDFDSYEIILVDDGSTDKSAQICDDYAIKYPDKIHLIRQENKGLLGARRSSIAHASGEYCLFLDSDDTFSQGCLKTLDEQITKNNMPDMVIFNLRFMNSDGTVKRNRKPAFGCNRCFEGEEKREIYIKMIESTIFNQLGFKAIKTSILQSDPTDYTVYYKNSFGEDLLQTLYPITVANKILYLVDTFYEYRLSDTSMIRTFSEESMDKRYNEALNDLFLKYMERWGFEDEKYKILHDARNYKVIVDTMVTFISENPALYGNVKKYSADFVRKHQDIKKIFRNKEIRFIPRIQLFLFSKGYFKGLLFMRKTAERIRKMRNK